MSRASGPVASTKDSPGATAAFFDVDGTIVSTHIVHQYLHVRKYLADRHGGFLARLGYRLWLPAFYLGCLRYLYLDRVSRTRMNIAFYRNYAGLESDRVREAVADCFDRVLRPNLFEQAVQCVGEHLRAGRRVVLVTGSIDFLIDPLARHLESRVEGTARVGLIARTLVECNGRFTGGLDGPPIGQREKAEEVRRYVAREGINLSRSYAYGDSVADLPMLELVGFPIAVNADRGLLGTAKARGWPCHSWRPVRNGS